MAASNVTLRKFKHPGTRRRKALSQLTGRQPEPAALDELDLVFSRVEWSTVMERNAAGRYRYRSKKEIFEIERHIQKNAQ